MRPTRDQVLVQTAFIWAQRSTCSRLQVGALIHSEGRILVQGYNGAPAGLPHCNHECDCLPPYPGAHIKNCNSEKPCLQAVHAEQNAIAYAAKLGVAIGGADMVVTHQPCASCAMSIINSGIREVTYVEPYRLVDGLSLLLDAGIAVRQFLDAEVTEKIGSLSD